MAKKKSGKGPNLFRVIAIWFQKIRQDKNLTVFLVFLIISTGFWFLNALRKNYTTTLNYPVKLVNVPRDKMIPDDFDNTIKVEVQAGGFVILRYRLSTRFLPLTFDLAQMAPVKKGDDEGVYVLTGDERNRIVGQLTQGMQLVSVEPDTLFVPLITRVTRKVPVLLNAEIQVQQQFMVSGDPVLEPDSVEIGGVQQVVDTTSGVYTRHVKTKKLSDTSSMIMGLDLPDGITAKTRKISVKIPVEPFTEINLKVPVEVKGLPDSLRIKTFPSEVQVSLHVGVSSFGSIDRSQFKAVVDVSPVFEGEAPSRLKVNLDEVPDKARSVKFSPIFVEYLLEDKR